MKLIAKYPILYQSRQYKVGDELPTNDLKMMEAWLEADTATKIDDTQEATSTTAPVEVAPVQQKSEGKSAKASAKKTTGRKTK